MASLETAVFISVLIASMIFFLDLLLLSNMVISVLLIVVLAGFIASALAGSEKNSYRVGGIAGGVLAFLFFLINFFTAPALTYDLYNLGIDFSMASQGLIYLILGFVLSLAIFMILGAIGGLIAELLLAPKDSEPERKSEDQRNSKPI